MNEISQVYNSLHIMAILGNIVIVFWILRNGINENFQGTTHEIISYISLMILLLLNSFLLYKH